VKLSCAFSLNCKFLNRELLLNQLSIVVRIQLKRDLFFFSVSKFEDHIHVAFFYLKFKIALLCNK
jgi:hypothetical protein